MTANLKVPRAELVEALKLFGKFARTKGAEALISFEDGMLTIELGGVTARAPAEGSWRGRARVPGELISRVLAKSLPAGDPLELRVVDGRFWVCGWAGGVSAACEWQDIGWEPIPLPLNPPLGLLRAVRLRRSGAEIDNAGLSHALEAADERYAAAVRRAAIALKALPVPPEDLARILDAYLKDKHKI